MISLPSLFFKSFVEGGTKAKDLFASDVVTENKNAPQTVDLTEWLLLYKKKNAVISAGDEGVEWGGNAISQKT